MYIAKRQLEILKLYQSGMTSYIDIAATLGTNRVAIAGQMYKFAQQNGIVDLKWFLRRLHTYDLSALRPTRERNLKTGRRVGIRQADNGRYQVYVQVGGKPGKRHFLGSWMFHQDAIDARLEYEKKHGMFALMKQDGTNSSRS